MSWYRDGRGARLNEPTCCHSAAGPEQETVFGTSGAGRKPHLSDSRPAQRFKSRLNNRDMGDRCRVRVVEVFQALALFSFELNNGFCDI